MLYTLNEYEAHCRGNKLGLDMEIIKNTAYCGRIAFAHTSQTRLRARSLNYFGQKMQYKAAHQLDYRKKRSEME